MNHLVAGQSSLIYRKYTSTHSLIGIFQLYSHFPFVFCGICFCFFRASFGSTFFCLDLDWITNKGLRIRLDSSEDVEVPNFYKTNLHTWRMGSQWIVQWGTQQHPSTQQQQKLRIRTDCSQKKVVGWQSENHGDFDGLGVFWLVGCFPRPFFVRSFERLLCQKCKGNHWKRLQLHKKISQTFTSFNSWFENSVST